MHPCDTVEEINHTTPLLTTLDEFVMAPAGPPGGPHRRVGSNTFPPTDIQRSGVRDLKGFSGALRGVPNRMCSLVGCLLICDQVRACQPMNIPENLWGKPLFPTMTFRGVTVQVQQHRLFASRYS